jgi:hypothetical protein
MVAPLRQICRDRRSFLWLCTALAGFCVRPDLLGVSSTVRALGLAARCYDRLLDFFHSPAIAPDTLSRVWTELALQRFSPHRLGGRLVLLGDGIKIPKSGRKMPAVKRLHQASDNNTKPEYISGHSVQVISVLVAAAGSFLAVPLGGRLHEGVKFSNRDQRTLPQKFCTLTDSFGIAEPFVMIADAYYACTAVASWALTRGCALISRLRRNAVAFELARSGAAGRACTAAKSNFATCSMPRPSPGRNSTARSMASGASPCDACPSICSGDRCVAWCASCWLTTPAAVAVSSSPPT